MLSKHRIRVLLLVVVLLSATGIAYSWATRPSRDAAPPTDGTTVITAQGREYFGNSGRMVAFGPNGSVVAEHTRYTTYFDVDPVPGKSRVVEYVAVDHLPPENCPLQYVTRWCSKQYVLRTNLTTDRTTTLWTTYYARLHKMHDFDRLNDTHIVVADIYRDSVHVVNLSTGNRTWTWNANQSYEYGADGGTGSEGFTHINDVERVRNGWFMVSLRNLDRVAFVDPGRGVVRNWTIGCEDCYGTLYEQHNPDYMPGNATVPPTVIVADSENDRIVEFRRVDGQWTESWVYTNADMHWPRDADRLPDGRTLITGSNANRVYEIDADGDVVWKTVIGNPYEAERLGTGDESVNRPHEPSTQVVSKGLVDSALLLFRSVVPSKLLSAALFVLPYWAGVGQLLVLSLGVLALLAGTGLEVRWRFGDRLRRLAARAKTRLLDVIRWVGTRLGR